MGIMLFWGLLIFSVIGFICGIIAGVILMSELENHYHVFKNDDDNDNSTV